MWGNIVGGCVSGLDMVVGSVRALVGQYKTRHEYQKYDPQAVYAAHILELLAGLALLALAAYGLLGSG